MGEHSYPVPTPSMAPGFGALPGAPAGKSPHLINGAFIPSIHPLSCRFVLDDLSALNDDDLAGRDMEPYPKLGLVVFKYGSAQELPERLARYAEEIQKLMATERGPMQWGELVDYTWHVNPHIDPDAFIERLRPVTGQEGERTMQTIADKLRTEGHQRGHQEGLSQGQRAILLQQLARRFGALPPETEERVARADVAELQRWALRVLDAATVDEVFASD